MIYIPQKFWHIQGLSFSGLDQSWRFPHATDCVVSGQSAPNLGQRDSHMSHNWWLQDSNMPWLLPEYLIAMSAYWILCQQWGLSHCQHRAHIVFDFQHSLKPMAHWLYVNHALVNIYISRRIQLFKWVIKYLHWCQWSRLGSILLLRNNMDLLTHRI